MPPKVPRKARHNSNIRASLLTPTPTANEHQGQPLSLLQPWGGGGGSKVCPSFKQLFGSNSEHLSLFAWPCLYHTGVCEQKCIFFVLLFNLYIFICIILFIFICIILYIYIYLHMFNMFFRCFLFLFVFCLHCDPQPCNPAA